MTGGCLGDRRVSRRPAGVVSALAFGRRSLLVRVETGVASTRRRVYRLAFKAITRVDMDHLFLEPVDAGCVSLQPHTSKFGEYQRSKTTGVWQHLKDARIAMWSVEGSWYIGKAEDVGKKKGWLYVRSSADAAYKIVGQWFAWSPGKRGFIEAAPLQCIAVSDDPHVLIEGAGAMSGTFVRSQFANGSFVYRKLGAPQISCVFKDEQWSITNGIRCATAPRVAQPAAHKLRDILGKPAPVLPQQPPLQFVEKRAPHKYDVFLSHNWGKDALGRDNHARVARLHAKLQLSGVVSWFDENEMQGDIMRDMTSGIDQSAVVVVFVTSNYMNKVAGTARDNCQKEFVYTELTKGSARILPVVMEPEMRDQRQWRGLLAMVLGNSLYVDASGECEAVSDTILERLQNMSHSTPLS